ncbi:unnamed protein product [Cuscuta campestris]|uniref:Retrotransposon gag domain-containing protein n=1 Tax=Cuscuta campestris TaxID=132261 RepID=A0A484ME94_9ASTE|nr:unnamed protein product [Cuscuta campestris]
MVQTRSYVPITSHVAGEENGSGNGNGTGGITSAPDAVQALFSKGLTVEQLQAAVAALSAIGESGPGTETTQAPRGPNTEHASTSHHKGKKTRRSRRRPDKAPVIKEVLVEDILEGEDDESSECQVSAFKRLGGEETRVSAFNRLKRGQEAPNEVKYRCLLVTLEGSACNWFNRISKGTIDDWDTLMEKFLTHYAANKRQRLPYSHLLNICIRKGEKVRDFIVRKPARSGPSLPDLLPARITFRSSSPASMTSSLAFRNEWNSGLEFFNWVKSQQGFQSSISFSHSVGASLCQYKHVIEAREMCFGNGEDNKGFLWQDTEKPMQERYWRCLRGWLKKELNPGWIHV